jgi:tetraacyldisaccharide 4'-kinase
LKSILSIDAPVISVGNLSVGGTGKSPMVEYLITLLKSHYKLTVISRGYGRKTKGYILASSNSKASEIGDEPKQILSKFPDISLAVSEKRAIAIERLFEQKSNQLFILDDAFQHRYVDRDVNILLTSADSLFYRDSVLPAGRLREFKRGALRADIVLVTKCSDDIDQDAITEEIRVYNPKAPVFFTKIIYDKSLKSSLNTLELKDIKSRPLKVISGIAKPEILKAYLEESLSDFEFDIFPDHYQFTTKNLEDFEVFLSSSPKALILTTEKDYSRLKDFDIKPEFWNRFYYIEIKTSFLGGDKAFKNQLSSLLES